MLKTIALLIIADNANIVEHCWVVLEDINDKLEGVL